jgi:hypothetical protein
VPRLIAQGADVTTYYKHRNRHDAREGPWGWITTSPDWQSRPVAYWSGWAGIDGANVLCGYPLRLDHDIRLPWSVVESRREHPWSPVLYEVRNALGYTVLSGMKSRELAEEVCKMAAATKEPT